MLKEKIGKRASDILGSIFKTCPLSPNQITLLAFVISFLSLLLFFFGYISPFLAVILFALSFFLDAIDGAVARAKGQITNLGAYIDGVFDRFVEFFFILFLIVLYPQHYVLFFSILFFGTCMPSFVRAYADHKEVISKDQINRKLSGIFERAERTITLLLVPFIPESYSFFYLSFILFLSVVTTFQRFFGVLYIHSKKKTSQ